jgi:hypothetical protein
MPEPNLIQKKRETLERFILEQTLGPGINGHRIVRLDDLDLNGPALIDADPLSNDSELLNIVPGAVYSTGILFPLDDSTATEQDQAQINEQETAPDPDGGDDTSGEAPDEEGSVRIDQMFPNSMGMTCCFDASVLGSNDLRLHVQARYYTRDDEHTAEGVRYGILCEMDQVWLQQFLQQHGLTDRFPMVTIGSNVVITYVRQRGIDIGNVRQQLKTIANQDATALVQPLRDAGHQVHGTVLSAIKQSLFYSLKYELTEAQVVEWFYSVSQEVESIENAIFHLGDLLDLHDGGYGIWRSNVVDLTIPFPSPLPPTLGAKIIYSCNERSRNYKPELRNIYHHDLGPDAHASLSLNLQLSRDSRKNDGKVFLKIQLLNTSTPFRPVDDRYYSTFNEVVNQRTFFGVKLSITDERLVPYNTFSIEEGANLTDEDNITSYIYRQFEDYGVGHGCSVKWSGAHPKRIETEYIPYCDTPDIDTVPRDKEGAGGDMPPDLLSNTTPLQFKWLSHLSRTTDTEVISGLKSLVFAYADWIRVKRDRYQGTTGDERIIALAQLERCTADQERMLRNIETLLEGERNVNNLKTFRLMNSSMFIQLWHATNVKDKNVVPRMQDNAFDGFTRSFYREQDVQFGGRQAAWRAFQLAFILLNLDGVFEPTVGAWTSRNEQVDLVWFPTGGGKTEAYLGIIALTILHRRRKHGAIGGGTAAIMRYTLRLLTLQQFQRATLVIMALELIRRWGENGLGEEPIYIGLWVGDSSLPNDLKGLKKEYDELGAGKSSRVPFQACPWCGSKLLPSPHIEGRLAGPYNFNRIHLYCTDPACAFHLPDPYGTTEGGGPIPVALCDDVIYQHPPALLFGTVDKFAQLAHKVSDNPTNGHKDSRRLFGRGDWEGGKPSRGYLPPDLIIQDELHLLLGPLGSAVALFEAAIDQLCTREDGTRPKVISSTATTRNTPLQIMALFDRRVEVFPKSGPECDDSFFAFYKREQYGGGAAADHYLSKRRYLGILPTGRTQIWMQMRLAAIFMTHRTLFELQQLGIAGPLSFDAYTRFEKAMDHYHTVISYFNSLKEVGKTESQVQTYLLKEVRRVFNRVVRPGRLMHGLYTYGIRSAELTGRLSGEEVAKELSKVGEHWSPPPRFAHKEERNRVSVLVTGSVPPDFVVATNMISVGIDFARFNTIIMNSMPRNIAEYIQASSRVAREDSGLVVTVHHPFRARDISHYEKFIEFHEKMYSYVEPISITPFTKRSVERYLSLYLATMVRHLQMNFAARNSAGAILSLTATDLGRLRSDLERYFIEREARSARSTDTLLRNIITRQNVTDIQTWIRETQVMRAGRKCSYMSKLMNMKKTSIVNAGVYPCPFGSLNQVQRLKLN